MKIVTNTESRDKTSCQVVDRESSRQVVYHVEIEESDSESNVESSIKRHIAVSKKGLKRRKPVTGRRISRPVVDQSFSNVLSLAKSSSTNAPSRIISRYNNVNMNTRVNNQQHVNKHINGEEVEEIAVDIGQTAVVNIPKWQRLIGNYQMTDICDIIDELTELVYQNPDNVDYNEALKEAREFQFAQSLKTRQRVKVRKDLDQGQFKKRAIIDYDRKVIDEHYRVVNEGHERGEKEKSLKRVERPKQENYGTKRYLPHLHGIPQMEKGPDEWL